MKRPGACREIEYACAVVGHEAFVFREFVEGLWDCDDAAGWHPGGDDLDLAAKHAVRELPAPPPVAAEELADRLAQCLRVFADRDQHAVREALESPLARLGENDLDQRIRAFARLGDLELFGEAGGARLETLFAEHIERIERPGWGKPLPLADRAVLALDGAQAARERFAQLGELFDGLGPHTTTVIASRPGAYFATLLPTLVQEALSFAQAADVVGNAVIPCAP